MKNSTFEQAISAQTMIDIINTALNGVDYRLVSHGLRVAIMSHQMLLKLGQRDPQYLQDAFITALLHDTGAYKTDDIDQMVAFESSNIWNHSLYGYLFLRKFFPLSKFAEAVLYHHLDFCYMNSIEPGLRRLAQVIHLCDRVDVYNENNYRPERLPALLRKEAGRQFDPELVELFLQLDEQCRFITLPFEKWKADYQEIALWIDRDKMQRYLEMVVFAIDFKSSFTVTHSVTTRTISTELAKLWGMDEQTIYDIWIGSLLHDVGKLYVETAIVEAPGRLTPEEMEQMRQHVDGTREVLEGRISESILEIACRHHEKLNGTGYPRKLSAPDLTIPQRIVCVADIASALSCARSYKPAFGKEKVLGILWEMVQAGELDERVVQLLEIKYDVIQEKVAQAAHGVQQIYDKLQHSYKQLQTRRSQLTMEQWVALLEDYSHQRPEILEQTVQHWK